MAEDILRETRRYLERNIDHSLDNGESEWLKDNGIGIVNELYDAGCSCVQSYSNDFVYVKAPMYYSRTLYITVPKRTEQIARIVQCILKLGFTEVTPDLEDPHLWKLSWTEGEFRGVHWKELP